MVSVGADMRRSGDFSQARPAGSLVPDGPLDRVPPGCQGSPSSRARAVVERTAASS